MYRPLVYIHTLGLELDDHRYPERHTSTSRSGSRAKEEDMKMNKTKMAFTVSPMINAVQAQLDELPSYRCTICHEVIGERRQDGLVENAVMLPCGHVFGRECIGRWLEGASSHQDCPNCRRRMVYSECGHHVRPVEIERKPRVVREGEMPGKCGICRGGGPGWEAEERLRMLRRRQEAEEKALVGMRIQLPGFFGAFCRWRDFMRS
jgi:Ring finger domain